jgi:DNA-binding protein H-NS
MSEYEKIMKQIEQLEGQAKTLWEQERDQAIYAAKAYIKVYELTEKDLFGRKVPVKYRDGKNEWTGRGLMPKWLKNKIEAGHDREEFRV